jgi:hypothetical protein
MFHRPLSSLALCPNCLDTLELQRAEPDGDGVFIYCACEYGPGEGLFAVWKNGALILKPCQSPLQAQVWGASIAARSLDPTVLAVTAGLRAH